MKIKILKILALFSSLLGLFLIPFELLMEYINYQHIYDGSFLITITILTILLFLYSLLLFYYIRNFQDVDNQRIVLLEQDSKELEKKIKIVELQKEIKKTQ